MDERQRSRSQELFQDKPVWNAIFAMAVPSCISILVMVCYNMADMFFVGQLGDTAQVAAVSVAGPVFSLITAVSTMIGMGGCSVIAQTAGQGKLREAKIYSSMCFYTAVFLGLLCTVVVLTGADSILKALGANEEILPFAGSYMRILAAGAVAMLLSVVLSSLIRADGAVREGLIGNLAGTAVNIVLDPIFILVLDMGIAGAAIATLIGNVVSSSFYLWYILKKAEYLSIRPFFWKLQIKGILSHSGGRNAEWDQQSFGRSSLRVFESASVGLRHGCDRGDGGGRKNDHGHFHAADGDLHGRTADDGL